MPFDVVVGPELPNESRPPRDTARAGQRRHIEAFARAGATWWIEGAYERDELRTVARGGPPIPPE
jgi:hypothetical protein